MQVAMLSSMFELRDYTSIMYTMPTCFKLRVGREHETHAEQELPRNTLSLSLSLSRSSSRGRRPARETLPAQLQKEGVRNEQLAPAAAPPSRRPSPEGPAEPRGAAAGPRGRASNQQEGRQRRAPLLNPRRKPVQPEHTSGQPGTRTTAPRAPQDLTAELPNKEVRTFATMGFLFFLTLQLASKRDHRLGLAHQQKLRLQRSQA